MSDHVSFAVYKVKPECAGCGRKLTSKEPALWFQGFPRRAVFGACCFVQGAKM